MSVVHQSGKKTKTKTILAARERLELTTPGLQDQRYNHWATEADTSAAVVYFQCFEPVFTRLCFYSKRDIMNTKYIWLTYLRRNIA